MELQIVCVSVFGNHASIIASLPRHMSCGDIHVCNDVHNMTYVSLKGGRSEDLEGLLW
jgi:uncharacterized protein (DUF2141 family)